MESKKPDYEKPDSDRVISSGSVTRTLMTRDEIMELVDSVERKIDENERYIDLVLEIQKKQFGTFVFVAGAAIAMGMGAFFFAVAQHLSF